MRMTMSQALDHDWLSEPSSQPMESPTIGLGGDSMWSIQSFDCSPSDIEFGYGPESSAKNWQRPAMTATVSGTRLESGVEGSDDFSQPLTKLHLNTSPLVAGSHVNIVSPSGSTPASPTCLLKQKRKLKEGAAVESERKDGEDGVGSGRRPRKSMRLE